MKTLSGRLALFFNKRATQQPAWWIAPIRPDGVTLVSSIKMAERIAVAQFVFPEENIFLSAVFQPNIENRGPDNDPPTGYFEVRGIADVHDTGLCVLHKAD